MSNHCENVDLCVFPVRVSRESRLKPEFPFKIPRGTIPWKQFLYDFSSFPGLFPIYRVSLTNTSLSSLFEDPKESDPNFPQVYKFYIHKRCSYDALWRSATPSALLYPFLGRPRERWNTKEDSNLKIQLQEKKRFDWQYSATFECRYVVFTQDGSVGLRQSAANPGI